MGGRYPIHSPLGYPPVPFKVNADRRHHIPRQRDRVTNWSEYDAGLRQRGSLTVWFSEEAIAAWRAEPRTTRGGQPHYSALAITTALTLRAVFRLALRQTEGLIGSVIRLLGLDLAIPDHSTLSRPAGRDAGGTAVQRRTRAMLRNLARILAQAGYAIRPRCRPMRSSTARWADNVAISVLQRAARYSI